MANSPPIHFRPAGTNPALDEIPIKGANLQGKLVGCVAGLLLLCGGVTAFMFWNMNRAANAAVPTLAAIPSETPTGEPTNTATPDAWALTGTAIFLATHTPTPTETPTATETFSVDAWAATGTALFFETPTPEPESTTDPDATIEVSAYGPLATYTPYPTYTPQPPPAQPEPRVITRDGETVVVTREVRVNVPQPVIATRIVPIVQTRLVPQPIVQTPMPTANMATVTAIFQQATEYVLSLTPAATATNTITPTPSATATATEDMAATGTAQWNTSATEYWSTVGPIWTQWAVWTEQAPTPTEIVWPTELPTEWIEPTDMIWPTDIPTEWLEPTEIIWPTEYPTPTEVILPTIDFEYTEEPYAPEIDPLFAETPEGGLSGP